MRKDQIMEADLRSKLQELKIENIDEIITFLRSKRTQIMEADLRSELQKLKIENIDEIITFLIEQDLLENAWKNLARLEEFLEGYGSFRRIPRPSPYGTKTITKFEIGK